MIKTCIIKVLLSEPLIMRDHEDYYTIQNLEKKQTICSLQLVSDTTAKHQIECALSFSDDQALNSTLPVQNHCDINNLYENDMRI